MENNLISDFKSDNNFHFYKLSIAPMLGITTYHFRTLIRLLSKQTLLYTEMINQNAILNSSYDVLDFASFHKPLVLQIGGNSSEKINKCIEYIKDKNYNYDEINLNCGCPDDKVNKNLFGAYLMKEPILVSNILQKINNYFYSSIKCRIGIDKYDKNFLENFIDKTNKEGKCKKYIIHSRICLMGLDTIKNRTIPKLDYNIVEELNNKYNNSNSENEKNIIFVVNGGIKTLSEVEEFNKKGIGVMIGRQAYNNPYMFKDVDKKIFLKSYNDNILNRKELLFKYSDECVNYINNKEYLKSNLIGDLIKPLTNLFYNESNNNLYKELLNSILYKKEKNKNILFDSFQEHIYNVIEKFEKINFSSLNN